MRSRLLAVCLTLAIPNVAAARGGNPNPPVPGDPGDAGNVALAGVITFGSLNLVRCAVGVVGEAVHLSRHQAPEEWVTSGYIIGASSMVQGLMTMAVGLTQSVPHSEVFVAMGAANLVSGVANLGLTLWMHLGNRRSDRLSMVPTVGLTASGQTWYGLAAGARF